MSQFFTLTLLPPVGAYIGDTAYGAFLYAGTDTVVPVYSDSACTRHIARGWMLQFCDYGK
jgi:hypothetical protein